MIASNRNPSNLGFAAVSAGKQLEFALENHGFSRVRKVA
jgi:hypothetical protein